MPNGLNPEEGREELESKQGSILWPEAVEVDRNSAADLQLPGDPEPRPVHRAGLIVLALVILLPGTIPAAYVLLGRSLGFRIFWGAVGATLAAVSVRILRKALLDPARHTRKH